MKIIDFIKGNRDYFEDFITRSTYHSNAIEGNTISYAETYAIIFNDNSFKVNAEPREFYEAINHKYALSYVMDHCEEELSEAMIKKIGITINKNIKEISGYRTEAVYIRGAEHVPPAPSQVPGKMMYYVYNYNHTNYKDVYEKMAVNHLEFERIHPFGDGNGRTGRLLLSYELLKNNQPPLVIPKEMRSKYFENLANTNVDGLAGLFKQCHQHELERIKDFGYFINNEKSFVKKACEREAAKHNNIKLDNDLEI